MSKQFGRFVLGTATGLIATVLQTTAVKAALVTSPFVWNGVGTGSITYQFGGVFTYDDSLSTATIVGNVATGFTNFVVNSLSSNGSPIVAFTPKQVVSAGSVVNICTGLTCTVQNDITFNTMTQTFTNAPQALGIETATTGFDYSEVSGSYYLSIGGGEGMVTAESNTGLTVPPTNAVPGPLPVVGVSMAWGLSRRLRKRVKISMLQNPQKSAS